MNHSIQTILIVDDEAPIRNLLMRQLEQEGYQTTQAANGDQALGLLQNRHFDLILLDLHMPGQVDGEELLYQMRDSGDDVPIVIVSGWVDDDTAAHHPDCVFAVLKKPLQKDLLIETVNQALSSDPLLEL